MLDLQREGRVHSVGVCNFQPAHLRRLLDETGMLPSINQIELSPYLQQRELRAFHAEHDIVTEAWSPLAVRAGLLGDPVVTQIATSHGVSAAQVVLRWHIELGNVVLTRSVTPSRSATTSTSSGSSCRRATTRGWVHWTGACAPVLTPTGSGPEPEPLPSRHGLVLEEGQGRLRFTIERGVFGGRGLPCD